MNQDQYTPIPASSYLGGSSTVMHPAANILTNFPAWDSLSTQDQDELTAEFIKTCFFLPRAILGNRNYLITKIYCVSADEFDKILWNLPETTKLHCEVSLKILQSASFVALSTRIERATGITYLVAKLWYGLPVKS